MIVLQQAKQVNATEINFTDAGEIHFKIPVATHGKEYFFFKLSCNIKGHFPFDGQATSLIVFGGPLVHKILHLPITEMVKYTSGDYFWSRKALIKIGWIKINLPRLTS